jgi:hypothetical protein
VSRLCRRKSMLFAASLVAASSAGASAAPLVEVRTSHLFGSFSFNNDPHSATGPVGVTLAAVSSHSTDTSASINASAYGDFGVLKVSALGALRNGHASVGATAR